MVDPQEIVAHGRNRVAFELLPERGAVLDYGCGDGHLITALAELRDIEPHGCDIRPEAVASLGEHIKGHVVNETNPVLPFADGYLAGVSMCDVLEHVPERSREGLLR